METSEGIFAMGGVDEGRRRRKEILQLECPDERIENCKWIEQDQELDIARNSYVAIPLPSSFSCQEVGMSSASIVIIVLVIMLLALAIIGFGVYKKYPSSIQFIFP